MIKPVIKDGVLYEAILTTLYMNNPYSAPVGFTKQGDIVEIKVYKDSFLSTVILETNNIVLNITHDPVVFIKTAFKKQLAIDLSQLVEFQGNYIFLKDSLGYIILEKNGVEDRGEYYVVKYRIIDTIPYYVEVEPYTRCYSQLIELAIYASKIIALRKREDVSKYLERVLESMEIVNKTCNSDYRKIAEDLWCLLRDGEENNY